MMPSAYGRSYLGTLLVRATVLKNSCTGSRSLRRLNCTTLRLTTIVSELLKF